MPATRKTEISTVSGVVVERRIYTVRCHNVMVDHDLAELYEVETSNLNRAVKRNVSRFPKDFMFQLKPKEWDGLICQNGISNDVNRGGRRYAPYVFTEQGVAMLSSVLSSDRAVQVNIAIMRAFVRIRRESTSRKDLLRKVNELEKKYDSQFDAVFGAIRGLMEPAPVPLKRRIGFGSGKV